MTDTLDKTIQLRLPGELINRLDDFRLKYALYPNRSQTIRWLLETRLDTLDEEPDAAPLRRITL